MIELHNVTIQAGTFSLRNVSFRIPSGEYAVLMGRTGFGKSTILEAICGLRKTTSGKVLLHNVDVTNWLPGEREIGYVPQDLALFPQMNVADHLAFALKLRRESGKNIQRRVAELAEKLQLTPLLKRSIHGLSGGEKQRVAIGRAISFRPKILLLDEPLSALDEKTRLEMHTLLKQITIDKSMTIIHVTHSESEAIALANRRFLLDSGKIAEVETQSQGEDE